MKKILLFAGAFLLVLSFIFLAVYAFSPRGSVSNPPTQSDISPTSIQTFQNPSETKTPEQAAHLTNFSSPYFTFSYNDSFSLTEGKVTSEGYTVMLRSPDSNNPKLNINIQVNPKDKVSVTRIEEVLKAFNLSKRTTTVGTLSASAFSNMSGVDQQTVTLFTTGEYVYRIDEEYSSSEKNPTYEAYYQEILNTFKPL